MTNPSTDQRRPEEKIKVFISHRHEDKETADALLQALISIGIPKSNIYSSSNAKTKTKAGYKYKEDLVKFLWECHVVFFLYSSPEKDWSYCSYEIGVANEESVETKIIPILLANQDSPSFIQDVQAIKVKGDQELTKAEFFELINNCFVADNFFPGFRAINPKRDIDFIRFLSNNLTEDMLKSTEKYRKEKNEDTSYRWGWFILILSKEHTDLLLNLKNESNCWEALSDKLFLYEDRGWGVRHFGYRASRNGATSRDTDTTLRMMYEHWQSELENKRLNDDVGNNNKWGVDIVNEIKKIYNGHDTSLTWTPFKSCYTEGYAYPVLTSYEESTDVIKYRVHVFTQPFSQERFGN